MQLRAFSFILFLKLPLTTSELGKKLLNLTTKIPFYAPVIWLAFVASKRRSEYQRLQQEYAHKEVLAKSYDKFKKQLEELDDVDKTLLKELIKKTTDAIAYNVSITLDGNHGDTHPIQGSLDKILSLLSSKFK